MKPTLLSVKELAQELGVSTQSIRRAYWDGLIPGYRFQKMLRFDVERIRQILLERGLVTMRPRRARPAAIAGGAPSKKPPDGKTGAEFPRFLTEGLMSSWTCVLGWFRFTVPDSSADEVIARVGGEWIKDKKGFLGYRQGWLSRGGCGGLGRIGTAASWAPREVHVDLSQELISDWTYQKFHDVATWVFEKKGHFGRIDVALDDRNGVIDVDRIYAAVKAGHCVSHFRQSRLIAGLDLGSGSDTGKTLCMGSRQSDTYLRIYDKAAEQRSKEKLVEGTWIRWEMEWKAERADAVGMALSGLDQDSFQKYIVGVFRSALDFRDCTRADDPKDRYYAPLLDWWKVLTEGMQRARLEIATSVKKIEEVKRWAEKSLAPMLGLLCAHPEAGERWLVNIIVDGVERWRGKHLALLASGQEARRVRRTMREWHPRDGFSAACAEPAS